MSGAEKKSRTTRTMEIEAQAAAWIRRRNFWAWSNEDQQGLDAWLDAALAHRIAYWRLNAALARTERLAALRPMLENPEPDARSRWAPLVLRIAAGVLLIAGAGVAGVNYYMSRPHERVFSTPIGGHEMVTFADGSRVELNTDTVLRTEMTSDARNIWLEKGEAYFQVKHDPRHPLVVIAGKHKIADLGTKFSVDRMPGKLEVALLEGSVRFGSTNGPSRLLKPGEEVTATPQSVSVTKKSEQELENALAWRHGLLVFKYTPLSEAAAQFNRYNEKKLVIADPAVAQLTVYGTIPVNDLDGFIRVARSVLGLHVAANGNNIVISR